MGIWDGKSVVAMGPCRGLDPGDASVVGLETGA